MRTYTGLDYETFSKVNLPERGLDNYYKDESFRALIASLTYGQYGAVTYDFVFGVIRPSNATPYYTENSVEEEFVSVLHTIITQDGPIIAHNASFERAVTSVLDPTFPWQMIEDSAVDARLVGVGEKLEVASRQLTPTHKLEVGSDLVRLFCIPNDYYPEGPTPELIEQHGHMDKWLLFIEYCEMDALACKNIRLKAHEMTDKLHPGLIEREARFEQETYLMNQAGWGVDRPLVEKMRQRAWANRIIAQRAFTTENDELVNFNSPKQLKEFCEVRGVKVNSLDKYHLPVVLAKVKERLSKYSEKDDGPELRKAYNALKEVEALLETKMEIGGSALSKLPKILDLMGPDGILRDQYIHVGAGQTARTAARGVQMQNIPKLNGNIKDVATLYDLQEHWSNGDMAGQFRQVFRSRKDDGELIVGDFAGVESRGLAYEAGEEWKLDVFRKGRDVYKELVVRFIPGLSYDDVTPELRPRGKYSELSCGYQASGKAVQEFMFRLGFEISLEDATQNVEDWRRACPAIVSLWYQLDEVLKDSVKANMQLETTIGNGLRVRMTPLTLESVQDQHPGAISLCAQILLPNGEPFVTRFIHGLYFMGKRLCYYKPAERLAQGELWQKDYAHKTEKNKDGSPVRVLYSVYGGKMSGIFTQSLCREMFFESTVMLRGMMEAAGVKNAVICGQFHDELNVDWWPEKDGISKEDMIKMMETAMSTCRLKDFPLIAEVKSSHRYIK